MVVEMYILLENSSDQMKIDVVPYREEWPNDFQNIQQELQEVLSEFFPVIEHFGSTSVPGLSAKPVIDIAVGIPDLSMLDDLVQPMMDSGYIYYQAFNEAMPERRLFVGLKKQSEQPGFPSMFTKEDDIPHELINAHRKSHVHVWQIGSSEWTRHIAFREYLKRHKDVRLKYQQLKEQLAERNWKDGMEYNDAKNDFIKREEQKAIAWYRNR